MRMELVLLLQELGQDKQHQQLLSPLPFPTTLPLLAAAVSANNTVVADPVRHLQVSDYAGLFIFLLSSYISCTAVTVHTRALH